MHAFRFAQACEEYEIGLTVMLQAARGTSLSFSSFSHLHSLAESNPSKVKILHNMVKDFHSLPFIHISSIRFLII